MDTSCFHRFVLISGQASKFGSLGGGEDDDDELDEESLLETPLDKIEPYSMFKHVLLGMCYFSWIL